MNNLKTTLGICALLALSTTASFAATTPDDHAPIGVMGDHVHKAGEWMLSYRYSRMEMSGNRDGNDSLSTADVLSQYMVAPLDMSMEMHMFGAMYALNDDLTFMAMAPYVIKDMNHQTRMGMNFSTRTQGIGDISLGGTYRLYASEQDEQGRTPHQLLLNMALSLPTGSIDERGNTPAMNNAKLPYPMQLGSGTYDPMLGLTYVHERPTWSFGSQLKTTIRFGENSEGYRLGNEWVANSWVSRNVTDFASLSVRLEGRHWGDIQGNDAELNPMMVPTARTDLRGGQRIDALIGLNLYKPEGTLAGNRLALEFGMPIYQELDGPQLETDHRLTLGWQLAF